MPGMNYAGGNPEGFHDWGQQQNANQYWQNMASQYQNMQGMPIVDASGQQYQMALDPATGGFHQVAYNPNQGQGQVQWGVGAGMPGGGPNYQEWGGLTDQPGFNMPGAYQGANWSPVGQYSTGQYQAGDQWGQGQYGNMSGVMQQGFQGYAPPSSLDPQNVIDASVAPLQHQRDVGFAEAAARAGGSGFAMSTPYMEQLGQVEQRSLQDLDQITQEYLYNAAVQKGNWDMQAQQAALDRSLSAYGTHSGYGHQGQMRDLSAADQAAAQQQALNAQGQLAQMNQDANIYGMQGGWQMDQNQFNQDAWRMENQYNQDAWRLGNQYANQDYWAGVNEWGVPMGMMGQITSAMSQGGGSPYGPAYQAAPGLGSQGFVDYNNPYQQPGSQPAMGQSWTGQ